MEEYIFRAKDVHWVYSEKTGAIPFIINEQKTKVKQLEDGFVLDILEKHQCNNPRTAAKNTFSDYYEQDMAYVGHNAMFAQVNIIQNLQQFSLQHLYEGTPLNMEQISFLSENYNKKIAKQHKKEAEERARQQAEEDARHRTFDF